MPRGGQTIYKLPEDAYKEKWPGKTYGKLLTKDSFHGENLHCLYIGSVLLRPASERAYKRAWCRTTQNKEEIDRKLS